MIRKLCLGFLTDKQVMENIKIISKKRVIVKSRKFELFIIIENLSAQDLANITYYDKFISNLMNTANNNLDAIR